MRRQILAIDESLCDGCGECVPSCAEGALRVVDGKIRLVGDALCDGLGACIGDCPRGALRVVERDAVPFDERAVAEHLAASRAPAPAPGPVAVPPLPGPPASRRPALRLLQPEPSSGGGCPGSRSMDLGAPSRVEKGPAQATQLTHWPVQIPLVSPQAPWLAGADLLVAADCVPFAYADFHRDLLAGRRVLVGCPKLDDLPGTVERLAAVFAQAAPRSVTVARMEVPCCGGIARAVNEALHRAGLSLPVADVVIGVRGQRLS
jgi:Pyruvate/2-oxoacid:ferredoxin oxidoreductase delta subunit